MRLSPWIARGFMGLARSATKKWTAPVRALRRERGLPDSADPLYQGQFSPHGTLALFSRVLGAPQPDWPAHTRLTGFPWFDGDQTMSPELTRFLDAGDPPIVFTLGTSAVLAPGAFYEESVRATQALGRRAVLLVGAAAAADPVPRSWPDNVIAVDYVSHAALFPRAAAVVHQGGVGTTGQALRAGVPTLVVPHAHDQPDNADRVVRLGVAQAIDARKYTAPRAAAALGELTSNARYKTRASRGGANRRLRTRRGRGVRRHHGRVTTDRTNDRQTGHGPDHGQRTGPEDRTGRRPRTGPWTEDRTQDRTQDPGRRTQDRLA